MGECFIMRRGGSVYRLPVLSSSYPKDVAIAVIDGQAESASFSVVVDEAGNPAFYTYQWYVDGSAVDGAVDASFTMYDITDAAIHNVHCDVKNKAGFISTRKAALVATRNDSPVLDTAYPADVSCEVGGSATFEIKIIKHGTSTEYSYQWYVDDVAVDGATDATFKLPKVEQGKHSVYCSVTSTAGTVRSRVATVSADTLVLYANGNVSDITGGWADRMVEFDGEVFDDDVSKSTLNSIDLTSFSKLCFEGSMRYSGGEYPQTVGFCVWRYATNGTLRSVVASKYGNSGNFTLDVSRLTGKYYIGYYVYDREYGSINMTKLYLKA